MKISGMIVASDGENKKGMIDIIDIPFYGGNKYLMRHKILSPDIRLLNGEPLISSSIKAMSEAETISDVVIVSNPDQCEELEKLALKHSNGKPFSIIEAEGHIGETISKGSENVKHPGYCFILLPDLPYVNGYSIDSAANDILANQSYENSIFFPVITKEFFEKYSGTWERPFFAKLRNNGSFKNYKALDFVIADTTKINPEFVRVFYNIRMVRSLKGKLNALKYLPSIFPKIFLKYCNSKLSITNLEEIGSELNGEDVKLVELNNPNYAVFTKDIDTKKDYLAYLTSTR